MTSWNYKQFEAGAAYAYDQADMTYDQATFDDGSVRYNGIGPRTVWTFTNKS